MRVKNKKGFFDQDLLVGLFYGLIGLAIVLAILFLVLWAKGISAIDFIKNIFNFGV